MSITALSPARPVRPLQRFRPIQAVFGHQKNPLTVEKAQSADLAAILKLNQLVFPRILEGILIRTESYAQILSNPKGTREAIPLIIRNPDRHAAFPIIGMATLESTLNWGHPDRSEVAKGYLYDLAVHPDWRHKGFAHQLLNTALTESKRLGYTHLKLVADTKSAESLYRSCGFEDDPEVESDFDDIVGLRHRV